MKNLFQNYSVRKVSDNLSVQVHFKIEEKETHESTYDEIRFIIYPQTNDKPEFCLFPSAINAQDWIKMREVSAPLEKLCRFQQAVVSNRMAEKIPLQMGLRPISVLDFLMPKRSFFFGGESFLKTIGYGILDIDRQIVAKEEIDEVLREFFHFDATEFQLEFDEIWNAKQDTETSRILTKQIDNLEHSIARKIFWGVNQAELELLEFDLNGRIQKLNDELRRVSKNLSLLLTHRQEQLIKFWLEKADEYFGKDIRRYLK